MHFAKKLLAAQQANRSLVCIGLDPDVEKMPKHLRGDVAVFCTAIIEATKDLVCCYKPNAAFFEALGAEGAVILEKVIAAVPKNIPVIYDAKRGDIGNTAAKYAVAAFDYLGVDAITVSPFLGRDSVAPFLTYKDKAVVILAKTSNPGADDFQDKMLDGTPLYEHVVVAAKSWGSAEQIAFVVGATYPEQMARIRALVPDSIFLVPGIGAQGGDVTMVVKNGLRADGYGIVINSSRGIIYASDGEDFTNKAREACDQLRREIEEAREI